MDFDEDSPNRCVRMLYFLWKIFTCLFLHVMLIAIVVGYCFLGAHMFQQLEHQHEIDMKRNITSLRTNLSEDIWSYTKDVPFLKPDNWTSVVRAKLKKFELELVWAMKKGGWDGYESEEKLQWTQGGALFYSIIVITTIGYGHIAPKTTEGKVATIFYAIIGIPLMLLCLSNIGDVMAQSCRFLYWRVFCYKCTQPPKRPPPFSRRPRSFRGTIRSRSGHSRTTSFRRSNRNSQRSADSAIGMSDTYAKSSYSDTECRYYDEMERENIMLGERRFNRQSQQSRYSDNVTMYHENASHPNSRRIVDVENGLEPDDYMCRNSPVVFNKYALDREDSRRLKATEMQEQRNQRQRRGQSAPLSPRRHMTPVASTRQSRIDHRYPSRHRRERPRSAPSGRHAKECIGPSPRIMSPLGLAIHRQTFPRVREHQLYDDYDYFYDYDYYGHSDYTKPVPIWLCVFLVVGYILGGAVIFDKKERDWGFFNSTYFCFITLTTIGFGDFVPEQKSEENWGIAVCSLYLLFGIALLAMSFNLVQEEVINNVKSVARHLGIIKDDDSDGDDS